MSNVLTLKKELELLERMEQALVIDEKERRKLAEVLFDAPEIARDAIFCYYAAIQRRVQIQTGCPNPPWPMTMTRGLGTKEELRVEIPPRSRCSPDLA